MKINYYYGAVFNGVGIAIMLVRNNYFWFGTTLAIIGYGICAYSYKLIENEKK